MASSSAPSWRIMQIPRPLQRLFDCVPLLTYDANDLPERSRLLTSSDLPTLYVFSTEEDARIGAPSFNPGCLKWQTLLRLASLQFRILPSTNHASPTGSLPFLLPPRSSPTASPLPIPADKLLLYAQQHSQQPPHPEPDLPVRAQAYLSLVTLSLRNAWLHALYLDPAHTALLRRLYIDPTSSSAAVRATLLYQLRRAAAEQIAASTNKVVSTAPVGSADAIDEEAVYAAARDALAALASLLAESETGWFFGLARPGEFDAAVFSYTHLMLEWMGEGSDVEQTQALGAMARNAGNGELARHGERMLEVVWPEWDRERR